MRRDQPPQPLGEVFGGFADAYALCTRCWERSGSTEGAAVRRVSPELAEEGSPAPPPWWFPVGVLWSNGRMMGAVPELCPQCHRRECEQAAAASAALDSDQTPRPTPSRFERCEAAGGNPWNFKATFADLQPRPGQERAYAVSREFSKADRNDRYTAGTRSVLLWGEFGRGKTVIGHCVLYDLLEKGVAPGTGVLYDDWDTFRYEVRATYDAKLPTWPLIRRRVEADDWICDDFLGGKVSPAAFELAALILNRREGRRVWLSTNEDPARLEANYAEHVFGLSVGRVASRLAAFRVVQVGGDADLRGVRF
ncbi:MAG TPA: hypothetical protein VF746_13455 [Longimicrobium sp.]|jgi:hypothetical protein